MTIDHIGAILYPDYIFLRIIGRIAFPIFCYLLVLGVRSTRRVSRYFLRLFLFAFISQIPFSVALGYAPLSDLNIFFTLSFGVMFLYNPLFVIFPIGLSLWSSIYSTLNFDYGLYGIALIACMNFLERDKQIGIVSIIMLNVVSLFIWGFQIFSLLALPIILLYKSGSLKMGTGVTDSNKPYPVWKKYFFYVYYPMHLTVLHLINISIL